MGLAEDFYCDKLLVRHLEQILHLLILILRVTNSWIPVGSSVATNCSIVQMSTTPVHLKVFFWFLGHCTEVATTQLQAASHLVAKLAQLVPSWVGNTTLGGQLRNTIEKYSSEIQLILPS